MTPRHPPFVVSLSLLVGLSVAGCSREATGSSAASLDPIAVAVAAATKSDVADTFDAGGVVQAKTTATLTARILAPVVEVRVAPGDRVRAGAVLIVLDGRELAADARRARAAGLSAEQQLRAAASDRQAADAALALARATHARIADLHGRRSATAQELDVATGVLRAAEAHVASAAAREQAAIASVDAARAAGDGADTTETFARVTAPFDGVVTAKMVEPGNMASPGTPLLRVEDTRGFRLDVRVDESRIGQITTGAAVPVAIDGSGDTASRTLSGTVTEISRAVDTDARAFLVKVLLPADNGLRSGMFGRARFEGRARRVLTVPAGALMQRGQMTSVFVVDQDVARLRLVNVRGTEVLAGLSDGEIVVVAPPASLTDGRRVKVGGR